MKTADLEITWKTSGGIAPNAEFVASTLISPAFEVSVAGNVTLTFSHRYDFESGWDGGAVLVSVNDAPAVYLDGSAFSSNGYIGTTTGNSCASWAGGESVFFGQSDGCATQAFVTSVASLGPLIAGDTISIQFRGEWDQQQTNGPPAWEISTFKLTDGNTWTAQYGFCEVVASSSAMALCFGFMIRGVIVDSSGNGRSTFREGRRVCSRWPGLWDRRFGWL